MKPTHIITDIHVLDHHGVARKRLIGKPCAIISEHRRHGANIEPEWKSLCLLVFNCTMFTHDNPDGSLECNFYKVKVEAVPMPFHQDQFVGDFEPHSNQEHFDGPVAKEYDPGI